MTRLACLLLVLSACGSSGARTAPPASTAPAASTAESAESLSPTSSASPDADAPLTSSSTPSGCPSAGPPEGTPCAPEGTLCGVQEAARATGFSHVTRCDQGRWKAIEVPPPAPR